MTRRNRCKRDERDPAGLLSRRTGGTLATEPITHPLASWPGTDGLKQGYNILDSVYGDVRREAISEISERGNLILIAVLIVWRMQGED